MEGFTIYVGGSTDYKQNVLCSLNQTFPQPTSQYTCTGIGQYVHLVIAGSSKTLHIADISIMGCDTTSVISFIPSGFYSSPSNIFDNILATNWNPDPYTGSTNFQVVFDVGEGVQHKFWGVHYNGYGSGTHDAQELRMFHSSSPTGPWTQAGTVFNLQSSTSAIQTFNFGQAYTNRYWKMEVVKTNNAWQLVLHELIMIECWSTVVSCPAGSTTDPCARCTTTQPTCDNEESFPPVAINTAATPVLTSGSYGAEQIAWTVSLNGAKASYGRYEVKASSTSSSNDELWKFFDSDLAVSYSFGSNHYRYFDPPLMYAYMPCHTVVCVRASM
jgi:hypothetical protein